MTLGSRAILVAVALLATFATAAHAQTREQKVARLMKAINAIDFPITRREALPPQAARRAHRELEQLGKNLQLGPEWKRGNSYFDRAEATLRKDLEAAALRAGASDPQQEAELKSTLEALPDAHLDDLLRLYASDLLRKATRAADLSMAMLLMAVSMMAENSERLVPQIEKLKVELERNELSSDEQHRLDDLMKSPAFQSLRNAGISDALSLLNDPGAMVQPQPSQAAVKQVVGLVAQFREAYSIAPPAPPSYAADFIIDPEREKSWRALSDAAIRNDPAALAKIVEAAKGGDAIAQAELGRLYTIGRGVSKDDKAAHEWTLRSADQGFPRAIFNLGVHYESGTVAAADFKKAAELYQQAAQRGFARAQLALGLMHRTGKGMPQDFQASLKLIAAAAKQNLPAAQLAMAEIYDAGAGVARDAQKADEWLGLAGLQNYGPAAVYAREREYRKAELVALVASSAPAAKGSPTAVDKPELNKRLLEAVKRQNLAHARELLDAGADIATPDEPPFQGDTPLHHAARSGNVDLARLLIAKGANVNTPGPTGFVPLHVASGLNERAMVEYLLSAGANPNALDRVGTPLHAATLQGHAAVVTLLLAKGANPNARREYDGATPLHLFSHIGRYFASHTQIIQTLVKHGADINAKDTGGSTPLDRAFPEAIPALIAAGAAPSKADPFELWRQAIRSGRRETLEHVERRGAPLTVKSPEGNTLLHAAVGEGEAIAYFLEKRLDPNAENKAGQTPLNRAIAICRKADVERLIKSGARLNHVSSQGITPVHGLVGYPNRIHYETQCEDTVIALMAAGANVRVAGHAGRTPLHGVAKNRGLLERMLKAGGDPRARDQDGLTPLHLYAAWGTLPELVSVLVKAGADLNAQDAKGRTPLHMYSEYGTSDDRLAMARALVNNGARLDVRDNAGQTPYEAFLLSPWGRAPREGSNDATLIKLMKGELR